MRTWLPLRGGQCSMVAEGGPFLVPHQLLAVSRHMAGKHGITQLWHHRDVIVSIMMSLPVKII